MCGLLPFLRSTAVEASVLLLGLKCRVYPRSGIAGSCGVSGFVFFEIVSLCSLSWPGTHYPDQAGLKLSVPPSSAS